MERGAEEAATCLLVLENKLLATAARTLPAGPVGGIRFVPFSPGCSAADQPRCRAVLHRAMYDLALSRASAAATERLALLRELEARGIALEPLASVERFADRGALCRMLARIDGVRQPRFVEVRSEGASVAEAAGSAGLRFPLLCKPLLASGPASSHDLAIVLHEAGLDGIRAPVLLQEYVPHGGKLIKAYCVGGRAHVAERASLPDLRATRQPPAMLRFNSHQPLPGAHELAHAVVPAETPAETPAKTPAEAAELGAELRARASRLVVWLAERIGLKLLGVDLIVARDDAEPQDPGELLIVDINYFPSGAATKFPEAAEALASFVRGLIDDHPSTDVRMIQTHDFKQ